MSPDATTAAPDASATHVPLSQLPPFTEAIDARLRESLKRCSPTTYEAARAFRQTGEVAQLHRLLLGIIERYVERERRSLLAGADDNVRLVDDLGLDSLTLMEIVVVAEEVLPITINNEEMCRLRTLGDVKQQVLALVSALQHAPAAAAASPAA
jgi:3-hydroxyacyl-[acyl-carrier-protein] dehydratase